MTFDTKHDAPFTVGSTNNLLRSIFVDDMAKRKALLDEWAEHRRREPEGVYPPPVVDNTAEPSDGHEYEPYQVYGEGDFPELDIDAVMGGLFPDHRVTAVTHDQIQPEHVIEPPAELAVDELERNVEAGLAEPEPFLPLNAVFELAESDPLYQLMKLVPEDVDA